MRLNDAFVISVLTELTQEQIKYIIDCWTDYVHNDLNISIAELPIVYVGEVI